jgi:hypothetical protein
MQYVHVDANEWNWSPDSISFPFLRYFPLSLSTQPCYNPIEIIPAAAPIPAKKSKASIF